MLSNGSSSKYSVQFTEHLSMVYNPYSRENLDREEAARISREEARKTQQNNTRTLLLLMNAQEKQKKAQPSKDLTRKHRGKKSASRRLENKASRLKKYELEGEEVSSARNIIPGISAQGSFQTDTRGRVMTRQITSPLFSGGSFHCSGTLSSKTRMRDGDRSRI